MRELVIGTRGSALALWQARAVESMLRSSRPDLEVRLEIIQTTGDKILDTSLSAIGDKGLFTKELEAAIFDGRAHIAVHSLKDMQTRLPEGLTVAAVTERELAADVLVAPAGTTLETIRHGGTVATGSLRRRAQLLAARPDLTVVDVRGNVQTRLRKYHDEGWDGMILAYAGLHRLDLGNEIAQIIPTSVMIPAVGQGALGIEARADDTGTMEILAALEHRETRYRVEAERAFLRALEGGCQVPIGAHAVLDGATITLDGVIASIDGRRLVRGTESGPVERAEEMGRELAERLGSGEGGEILEEIRSSQAAGGGVD